MKNIAVVLLCLSMLSACSQELGKIGGTDKAPAEARAPSENKPRAMLAYEHSIEIETEAAQVPKLYASAQQLCIALAEEACVVLASNIRTGEPVSSSLKFRAKHNGITKIIDGLSQQGTLVNRSTVAEDLGGPIEDGAKKLQMLKDYRSKLEALQARAQLDVDALIKLTRELADVQNQLEALAGSQAKLVQRVDTEILRVDISVAGTDRSRQPVAQSLSQFGRTLSEGIASTITVTAFILPWLILLTLFTWGARKLWRVWRKTPKSGA